MSDYGQLLDQIGMTLIDGAGGNVGTLRRLETLFDKLTQALNEQSHTAAEQCRNLHDEIAAGLASGKSAKSRKALSQRVESGFEALTEQLSVAATAAAPSVNAPAPTETPTKVEAIETDPDLLAGFISEAHEHLESAESNLLQLEENPHLHENLDAVFRAFHSIKGVAGFLSLTHIQELAHEAENLLDLARSGALELTGAACDLALASVDAHKQQVRRLVETPGGGETPEEARRRERLMHDMRNLAAGTRDKTTETAEAPTQAPASGEPEPQAEPTATAKPESALGVKEAVKVDRERLDKLIDMIGELVIAESMVHQEVVTAGTVAPQGARNLAQLNKITRNLQQLSLSLRMVPIRGTFQKMARLVRDVSKKIKKNVDFHTVGEETELDKAIVDKVGDPMVHLLRNSIDHGLEESSEARVAAGKSPRGQVTLRAFHQTGNILIEIEDDGRGLNRTAILAKAKQRGLVSDDQVLSDNEVYNLIFHAGFSTAEKVTDVSGRGVGMDVVKRNVEALGGTVTLRSAPGRGTVVSMRLPLTLAIIDGMVVRVGTQRYVIPTLSIVELIGLDAVKTNKIYDRDETIVVRDQILPLYRVDRLLQMPSGNGATEHPLVVVVEDQGSLAGLLVEEVLGQQQVVIKSLDGLDSQRGIAGGAVMPDGAVGIILDVHDLLKLACDTSATA